MVSADIFAAIAPQLRQVDEELYKAVESSQVLLQEASHHLVGAGGKRLRPAFVLLAGGFFIDDPDVLIPLATAMELIHMATLVHDDVIDNSSVRRGRETVKVQMGNRISVYSGDFILARSLAMVTQYEDPDMVALLAEASVKVCEGEISQMQSCFDVNQNFKDYLKRIERKTALLIALSGKLGAMAGGGTREMVSAIDRFGYYLGMAFQITDDILDFTADEATLGKPVGSDIRQGIITLPALYALHFSRFAPELREILGSPEAVETRAEQGIQMVLNSGGIEYSYGVAARYIKKARRHLQRLPEGPSKTTFGLIADFICSRDY